MNREIIFRGKRLDNGEWVYGSLLINNNLAYIHDEHSCPYDYDFIPVDPDTVGQYTGLKDKNGKEIWERDIVKRVANMRDYAGCDGEVVGIFYVQYSEYGLLPFCELGYRMSEYEIIGNLPDNPELLEGDRAAVE